jgi:hypothetical protein
MFSCVTVSQFGRVQVRINVGSLYRGSTIVSQFPDLLFRYSLNYLLNELLC